MEADNRGSGSEPHASQAAIAHSRGSWWSKVVVLGVALIPLTLAYFAVSLAPSGAGVGDDTIFLFGGLVRGSLDAEGRMILYVGLLGGLGGYASALKAAIGRIRSIKNVTLLRWLNSVLFQTGVGMAAGIIFYNIIRVAAFSPGTSVHSVNVLGITVLSLAAGILGPVTFAQLEQTAFGWLRQTEMEPELARAIQHLDARVGAILARPTLDAWSGRVAIQLQDNQLPVRRVEAQLRVVRGASFSARVRLIPAGHVVEPLWEENANARVDVRGGESSAALVAFETILNGTDLEVTEPRRRCEVGRRGPPIGLVIYPIMAPDRDCTGRLTLSVFQKGVLIQTLVLRLVVGKGDDEAARSAE